MSQLSQLHYNQIVRGENENNSRTHVTVHFMWIVFKKYPIIELILSSAFYPGVAWDWSHWNLETGEQTRSSQSGVLLLLPHKELLFLLVKLNLSLNENPENQEFFYLNCLRQTWRKILKPFMFYRIFLNPFQTEISRLLWSLYLQVAVHNRCCPGLPHLGLTDGLTEQDYR